MPRLNRHTERHSERHRTAHIGWLRAAVLGANDGIVSTASLMLGVATANAGGNVNAVLLSGLAGLVAGAMAMAAGEYVSVHSQADTERADLAREKVEIEADPAAEQRELAAIYAARGLDAALADKVAQQLMQRDALGAHARDELGQSAELSARPLQAAAASAASFAVGAAVPLVAAALAPAAQLLVWVPAMALVSLAGLGALAARVGGAPVARATARVALWGALAMLVTALAGRTFGAAL